MLERPFLRQLDAVCELRVILSSGGSGMGVDDRAGFVRDVWAELRVGLFEFCCGWRVGEGLRGVCGGKRIGCIYLFHEIHAGK